MAQHFAVEIATRDHPDDLAAFRSLALKPGVTVDHLWDWLQARGYKLARSSVGNYVRWLKSSALGRFAPMLADDDSGNLRLLSELAPKMPSEQIRMAVLMIQFLSQLNAGQSAPTSGPTGEARASQVKAARAAKHSTPQ
jgi:hypothetical protein